MDELFFLPSAKVAMPRAYWGLPDTKQLSALVVVIEPSYREYNALMDNAGAAIYGQVGVNETTRYDVTLLNDRYGDSALVLPHRQYGLISSEFRRDDHRNFLGNEYEDWDPERVIAEAKIVHFADAPLPKPWIMWPQKLLVETLPKCKINPGTAQESGCQDRQVWRDLYNSFRRRRRVRFSFPLPSPCQCNPANVDDNRTSAASSATQLQSGPPRTRTKTQRNSPFPKRRSSSSLFLMAV